MDLTNMTKAERIEMMRKRQAYFSAIAEEYASFADFIKAQDMWLALMGVELTEYSKYITLYIQLDFTEYEQYYIRDIQLMASDGHGIIGRGCTERG